MGRPRRRCRPAGWLDAWTPDRWLGRRRRRDELDVGQPAWTPADAAPRLRVRAAGVGGRRGPGARRRRSARLVRRAVRPPAAARALPPGGRRARERASLRASEPSGTVFGSLVHRRRSSPRRIAWWCTSERRRVAACQGAQAAGQGRGDRQPERGRGVLGEGRRAHRRPPPRPGGGAHGAELERARAAPHRPRSRRLHARPPGPAQRRGARRTTARSCSRPAPPARWPWWRATTPT